uniref:Uncharacterized protein n=1 Tax=Sphingomonas sp. KSM1 TaxID=1228049 RepID=M1VHK9_9SPHN|nr:hypothetical protein [Sphingomonas sp. KSM1]
MNCQPEVIEQLEVNRWKANPSTDIATLQALLAGRLKNIHPTSKVDTKRSSLAGLQVRNPCLEYQFLEQDILPLADTVDIMRAFQATARRDPFENSALVRTRSAAVGILEESGWRPVEERSHSAGRRSSKLAAIP